MVNNGPSFSSSSDSSSPSLDRSNQMEKTRVPGAQTEQTSGFRARLGRIRVRGYYWPVRTIVQLSFFVLFSGIGIMSLIPAFNGTRSWIVLPIVSSVKSQAQVTSTMDAITLFLENGLFPWLPVGIMLVVGAILSRLMQIPRTRSELGLDYCQFLIMVRAYFRSDMA